MHTWSDWTPHWAGWQVMAMAALACFAPAGFVGCYLVAVAIALSRDRDVRGWLMSAQAIEDGKGFLRIRVDGRGRVTVYPLLIENVCHDWNLVEAGPAPTPGAPVRRRPVPAGGPLRVRLVEPPFVVDRAGGPPSDQALCT